MSNIPKLSVIVPAYNEAGNIPDIFERFREAINNQENVEVIIVNNGSTDDSQSILETHRQKAEYRWAKLVKVDVNQGYGFGIMMGIRQATGDILSWTHADMQTDPADVLEAYEQFVGQPNLGETFLKGRRISRNLLDAFFTFGMSVISSLALGQWLSDVNAQPKMFHRTFLERMTEPPDDFSLDLYVLYLAKKLGMTVLEQPVSFAKRRYGQAKGGGTIKGKLKLIKRTWNYIQHLRKELKR